MPDPGPDGDTHIIGGQTRAWDDPEPTGPASDPTPPPVPPPLLTRRVAAEVGLYVGGGLALFALAGYVARGWAEWDSLSRVSLVVLAAVAPVALGLFGRLPWSRTPSDMGRRAISTLLTAGAGIAAAGLGSALSVGELPAQAGPNLGAACVAVALVMLAVNLAARTPLSETALLAAAAWGVWILVPTGPPTWATLVTLGVVWAVVGFRWARGRWTAGGVGAGLALVACVGLASGAWAWPARAGLLIAALASLVAFVRGGANYWLALGAGASTALAASVAGAVVGPVVALLVGGLATMVVSWIALRTAGEH